MLGGRLHKPIGVALFAASWWLLSCRDIPSPEGGVFAISRVALPSPGIVAGDTMRDSAGLATPLSVVAYDENGKPMSPAPAVTYLTLDTLTQVDGAWLTGRTPGSSRLVAAVSGLQSQPVSVQVTLSPDTIVTDTVAQSKTFSLINGDTSITFADVPARVRHLPSTAVAAVIVYFKVERFPAAKSGGGPTVVLRNNGVISDRDTTDATGRASVVPIIRLLALQDATRGDTAILSATASYRGRTLGKVQFFIIFAPKS